MSCNLTWLRLVVCPTEYLGAETLVAQAPCYVLSRLPGHLESDLVIVMTLVVGTGCER